MDKRKSYQFCIKSIVMKKAIALLLLGFGFTPFTFSQTNEGWHTEKQTYYFVNQNGDRSTLEIDPGLRYAEFFSGDEIYRFFFNRDKQNISQIRIIDAKSKEEIARGKGGWGLGNAHLVFDGDQSYDMNREKNPNGYTIVGPYGPIFKVESQKIETTQIHTEKDLLVQAFFVFDRIRSTQSFPTDLILAYSINN